MFSRVSHSQPGSDEGGVETKTIEPCQFEPKQSDEEVTESKNGAAEQSHANLDESLEWYVFNLFPSFMVVLHNNLRLIPVLINGIYIGCCQSILIFSTCIVT